MLCTLPCLQSPELSALSSSLLPLTAGLGSSSAAPQTNGAAGCSNGNTHSGLLRAGAEVEVDLHPNHRAEHEQVALLKGHR